MPDPIRRGLVAAALLACAAPGQTQTGNDYPSKPIKVVVPSAAGGNLDISTRLLMQGVSAALGQPIVVENRPGASLLIGTQYVAKSPPDGYTLLAMSNTFVTAPALVKEAGYDPIKDFTGIAPVTSVPLVVLVGGNSPFKTMADLVAQARSDASKISYASAGSGSSAHVAAAMLFSQMGTPAALHVPYKGNAPAQLDVMSGRVTLIIDTMSTVLQQIQAGKLRALAVTSPKRSPALPDVPTVAESGFPGYATWGFTGICAPAGTPQVAVQRFQAAMAKAMTPDLRERFLKDGIELPSDQTPQQYTEFLRDETTRFAKLVKDLNIRAE